MIKQVTPAELRDMLKNGVVKFQYEKKNKTIRTAVGTTNTNLITNIPTGGYNPAKEVGYSIYFDLDKDAFRCYSDDKIVGVVIEDLENIN